MGKTKRDEYGDYDPDAGSPHPVDSEDAGYEPCNAVLKHTFERYGERRYCTGMAVGNFGDAANYEHPEYCKHHQSRAALMKQHAKNFKTGAHAKSHAHAFQHMPPHQRIIANDLYDSLVAESSYDFETETNEIEIDVSGEDFAPDADTLVLEHQIPTTHQQRGKALWFAALDFVVMENIRKEQFKVAAEDDVAPGEKEFDQVTDDGNVITIKDEHHLNMALSRIQKDYKEHMKFGGVEVDGETGSTNADDRVWVATLEEPEPEPESKDASPVDDQPLEEIEVPDTGSGSGANVPDDDD